MARKLNVVALDPKQCKITEFFGKKKSLAQKVNKLSKMVKENKPEIKTIDVGINSGSKYAFSQAAPWTQQILNIAQGDGLGDRTANEIRISSVDFKCEVALGVTGDVSPATQGYCQAFLVHDTQTTADTSTPTIADIWVSSSSFPSQFRSLVGRGRYKILAKSKLLNVSRSLTNDTVTLEIPTMNNQLHFRHKFKRPLVVRYNGSATTDIQKNALYLVMLSNHSANMPIDTLILNGNSRINFTDV